MVFSWEVRMELVSPSSVERILTTTRMFSDLELIPHSLLRQVENQVS